MSEFADMLGLPSTIRHAPWKRDKDGKPVLVDGKPERLPDRDFTLAPPDEMEVQGKWEMYLEDQAFQVILRRYRNSPAMLQAAENNLNASIVAGDYSVFGAVSVKAMQNPTGPHFRRLIFFLLAAYLPEREAEQIAEEFAKEKITELYRIVKQANAQDASDPKGQPATAGANDLPPSSPNSSTPGLPIPLSGVA